MSDRKRGKRPLSKLFGSDFDECCDGFGYSEIDKCAAEVPPRWGCTERVPNTWGLRPRLHPAAPPGLTKEASLRFSPLSYLLLAAGLAVACPGPGESPPSEAAADEQMRGAFADITQEAGIEFRHFSDASPQRRLPETMGAGAAFFDFDNDGLADLYLVNGASLEGDGQQPSAALYRNLGQGRFEDVSEGSGLEEAFYGMGAAVGDADNDGDIDLFVTGLRGHRFYRNLGRGRFEDHTAESGIADRQYGSSAAFLDYDKDGQLDLFVARYVKWSADSDIVCSLDGANRTYCTPEEYQGLDCLLYRNIGGGRFSDVSRAAGIAGFAGKALGVAVLDYNHDGWPDIAVANDTVRNFLFVNQGDGSFDERGVESGIAYSESGATRGGMGIDSGDFDRDGEEDILIGNFSQEMAGLYRGGPGGFFIDEAAPLGVGIPTLLPLAFGTLMEDFDGDGWLDAMIANGHIEPEIARSRRSLSYAQQPLLFWNSGGGRFEPFQPPPGDALSTPLVARGLASADIDLDGDLDLIVTQNGREARLFRNDSPPAHWLRLRLKAASGSSTPFGTVVRVVAGEAIWQRSLQSGRSYLSACEPVLTLGLGKISRVERLEIRWPSGRTQVIENPQLNQTLQVTEEGG